MIVNWAIDTARSFAPRSIGLRLRSRDRRERVPVVVVPPMLGTRLRDADGRRLWGWTRNIFRGPEVGACSEAVVDGPLERLTLVPGIYGHDVHRGMIEYLCRVGGYRRGRDLFVLDYDWRLGIERGARELATFTAKLDRFDLICPSSAGLIARHFLLYGRREDAVRRVVYIGTPQRGTLEALNVLHNGLNLLPYVGRRHPTRDIGRCQIVYDLLPHPDERVAVDEQRRELDVDLYDAATWRRLGLAPDAPTDLGERLDRAKRLHRALDRALPPHRAIVIGAKNQPTRSRFVVDRGRALVPPCWYDLALEKGGGKDLGEPGDASITAKSQRSLPLDAQRIAFIDVVPRVHQELVSDPVVHVETLRALLEDATDIAPAVRETHAQAV
jgi:hypothetical protein